MKNSKSWLFSLVLFSFTVLLQNCASGGGPVAGNENGSQPVNEEEVNEYKRAINKCYRTGGTRVVKIVGKLRCY